MNAEDIFADRRRKDTPDYRNNRRADFSNHIIKPKPWWLKVNYVDFHSASFDSRDKPRRRD